MALADQAPGLDSPAAGVKLRPNPSITPWLLAAGATALLAGSLFRAYVQTGTGLFRMFGTISLVLIGYFATRTAYALQEGDALDRLRDALAKLPAGFDLAAALALPLPDRNRRKPLVVDLTVLGQRSLILIGIDATRPIASRRATLNRLRHRALTLWQARRILEPRLSALTHPVPVTAVILSLYRDPGVDDMAIEGIPLLTVDNLTNGLSLADSESAQQTIPTAVRTTLLSSLSPAEIR